MDYDNTNGFAEETQYHDIDGIIEALRDAWKCVPSMSLSELLDNVSSAPFCELTSDELKQELNEFILQNQ